MEVKDYMYCLEWNMNGTVHKELFQEEWRRTQRAGYIAKQNPSWMKTSKYSITEEYEVRWKTDNKGHFTLLFK